ncbi:MAG: putative aminopeptidase 1 [archaeon ADurb.Bin336]|nr:MAG: putative aminopeptidase 1 [archaeon ADurb.Bin336]
MAKDKKINEQKNEKSKLEKELFYEQKSAWDELHEEKKQADKLSKEYREFLDNYKTEREIVEYAQKIAKKNGFVDIKDATPSTKKIYATNHSKNIVLIELTNSPLEEGMRIIGTHIDSLRLDLKMSPVYETNPFLMINLHYYGGIKKYHWLNTPLAMHGVVFNNKGEKIEITIGEKEDEPVFVISDLLPHLEGSEGREKLARDIIKGEELDAIGATIPIEDKKIKERIKATFLKIMNDKYKITERDFASAELSLYPAVKSREVGIDRGMIGAPAHDDRICSYLGLEALLKSDSKKAKLLLWVDKEEIGSKGNTSMESTFLENTIEKIIALRKEKTTAKEVLQNSKAISGDVTSGFDPKFADKMDPTNMNKPGYGVAVEKYTGAGGKSYGSDANAEYISWIRMMLQDAKIPWQHGELGKVDQGGGGTIAYILAKYNMNIVDMGTPVLAMHSPFEIVSKIDLYATYKAYKAFYERK